jgi:hypothetical protein
MPGPAQEIHGTRTRAIEKGCTCESCGTLLDDLIDDIAWCLHGPGRRWLVPDKAP